MRFVWIFLVVLAGAVAGYLLTRFEGDAPAIETATDALAVSTEHVHHFRVSDEGMGLERVRVWLEREGKEWDLAASSYPGDLFRGASLPLEQTIEVRLQPRELGLADGPATLIAEARDWAWSSNVTRVEIPVTVDTRAPRISVLTGLTYARQGGTELAVYRLDEAAELDGVEVGEEFFRGHPHPEDSSRRLAFYALPARGSAQPSVVAADLAGNRTSVGLNVNVSERSFPAERVALSRSFMETKYAELIGGEPPQDVVAGYLKINRDMRAENARRIREVCAGSSGERLWTGSFLQLPNSQLRSGFAEQRTYTFEGRQVDRQVHLGYDLASVAGAAVPASNDGRVAFADDLGIYGKTVILDHGLGLLSLYGHLSEISVKTGASLARGEILGRTGQTGLAGGDHLHFSILVDGVFVDPVEWFDERWIREHIEPDLAPPEPTGA